MSRAWLQSLRRDFWAKRWSAEAVIAVFGALWLALMLIVL